VRDIQPGTNDGDPYALTPIGNMLYFAASEDDIGYGLWRSDGTTAGTVKVLEIDAGTANSLWEFRVMGGVLYFFNEPVTTGTQLWRSDGTPGGTTLVRDFPGDEPWYPLAPSVFEGELWFQGRDDAHGYELWRSDGTPSGTRIATDTIRPGRCSAYPYELSPLGDQLVFGAFGAATGYELWSVADSDVLFTSGFEAAQ
jgi:ELWxxDGT repeat protein